MASLPVCSQSQAPHSLYIFKAAPPFLLSFTIILTVPPLKPTSTLTNGHTSNFKKKIPRYECSPSPLCHINMPTSPTLTSFPPATPAFTDSKYPTLQWNTTQPYERMRFRHLSQHYYVSLCWWNKSDIERLIWYGITYTWNLKKYNKLVNITKRKQTHREKKISDSQWGGEVRGNTGAGERDIQTTGYKIGSRMHCTTQEMEPIFCNNCKWKVTFKVIR